jgi:lipoprotein-anchoring transpeptidase ErfK/SrfK
MRHSRIIIISLLVIGISISIILTSHRPAPPEVKEAQVQDTSLRGAGSTIYMPDDYQEYRNAYQEAKLKFNQERKKLVWFRQYRSIAADFAKLLQKGERLRLKVEKKKKMKAAAVLKQLTQKKNRIDELRALTLKMNEGRMARGFLVKADLTLAEAGLTYEKGNYLEAEKILQGVYTYIGQARAVLNNVLDRYKDDIHIAQWTKWIDETLEESKKNRTAAIIVDKIHRELTLYRKGKPVKTYKIGLGSEGLENKLYAGDNATPEGKYHVIKKHPTSQYYKALLLDYPNQEDRRKFYLAQKKGLIPKNADIGGWIEIHGGGKAFMTQGCVSLENEDMDEVFQYASVGTPVTIVGSIGPPHKILSTLSGQAERREHP